MPNLLRLTFALLMLGLFPMPRLVAQSLGDEKVTVRVVPAVTAAEPGGRFAIAVVIDHAPGWHTHTNSPVVPASWAGFVPIPTTIAIKPAPGIAVGPIQWPEVHEILVDLAGTGRPEPYPVFEGTAVAFIPIEVEESASGEVALEVAVDLQACDDSRCLPPDTYTFALRVAIGPGEPTDAALFAAFDASVFADRSRWGVQPATPPAQSSGRAFFGITLPSADGVAGVVIVALLAAVGGFILNLTPCVLPVIPIKVLTISQHAGSPRRSLALGLWMALGVVAFWVGIGLPMAFLASVTDPSRIFGVWWVTLGIGLLIGAMGVGIMGAFAINLPKSVYAINPKADSAWGSFVFGVMTAVLGLPCFGFVAGALLAGAAALPPGVVMVIFTALGVGMASPYLVLSANPKLLARVPRTGPASELVKQVMGLLLLAAAAYFVGSGVLAILSERPGGLLALPWYVRVLHWWVIAAFVLAAAAWLARRTFAITTRPVRRGAFSAIALALAGSSAFVAVDMSAKARDNFWVSFDPQLWAETRASGRVVVIDFTAEWCLNCKALKAAVLNREPVKSRLRGTSVLPMTADLTSTSSAGWTTLRDLGQTGIPLLVIDGPGLSEPWLSNAYTAQQVMEALDRASRATPP
ncbi:MAG: thioredoxin family protein [Phycisphaeraceae bacterium]|nr:thioredoxin family protein [Phycisphaeraceae bacterium]